MEEQVLVIPKKVYFDTFDESSSFTAGHLKQAVQHHGKYLIRSVAEQDYNYLQVIPYVVVKRIENNHEFIFTYIRSNKGKDRRLYGKTSIGVGGHVNPEENPSDRWDDVINSMYRELDEELKITPINGALIKNASVLAGTPCIYDPRNNVGEVHIGLPVLIDLTDFNVSVKETDKITGTFMSMEELFNSPPKMLETWSDILITRLKTNIIWDNLSSL